MTIGEKVVKGISLNLVNTLVGFVIGFPLSVIIARSLGADEYGLLSLVAAVTGFFGMFIGLGTGTAMTKFLPEHLHRDEKDNVKGMIIASFKLHSLLGMAGAILCFLLAEYLANNVFHASQLTLLIKIAAIGMFIGSLSGTFATSFQGYQKWEYHFVAQIATTLSNFILVIILLYLGYGIVGVAAAGALTSIIVAVLIFYIFFRFIYPGLKDIRATNATVETKRLVTFGFPLMLSGIAFFVVSWTDSVMLGMFRPTAELSYYRVAVMLAGFVMVFPTMTKNVLFPATSELYADKDKLRLEQSFTFLFKHLAYIGIPIGVGLALISENLISVLYGEEYLPAVIAVQLLAVIFILRALSIPVYTSLVGALGKSKIQAKIMFIIAPTNVALNLLLIPNYGYIGAIIATLGSLIIGWLLTIFFLTKYMDMIVNWSSLSKSIVSVAGMACFIIFVNNIIPNQIAQLVCSLFFGALIYFLALVLLKGVNKNDIDIFENSTRDIPIIGQLSFIVIRFLNKYAGRYVV